MTWSELPYDFRNHVNSGRSQDYKHRVKVAEVSCFGGRQLHQAFTVGEDGAELILVETHDLKDGVWRVSRSLTHHHEQVHGIIAGLQAVAKLAADLDEKSEDEWPALPVRCGMAAGERYQIFVLLDRYNGRLDARLSKALSYGSGRSTEWLKFSIQDIDPMVDLFVQSHDAFRPAEDATANVDQDSESIPF
ncbi:MAG TPA: hypothetical protein VGK03_11045 [Geothrix sp.]|jgi:hypothetical protein